VELCYDMMILRNEDLLKIKAARLNEIWIEKVWIKRQRNEGVESPVSYMYVVVGQGQLF
jgi:hypothetical protein